eukprot:663379-Rhodomonas_salina.1
MASCSGIANCTGAGFAATCQIANGTLIAVSVQDPGSGYDSRYPPAIACAGLNQTDGATYQLGSNASGVTFNPVIVYSGSDLQCEPQSALPDTCIECLPGFSSPDPGSTNCSVCERGTYSQYPGAPFCVLCEPGRYRPEPGDALDLDARILTQTCACTHAPCLLTLSPDSGIMMSF